MEPMMTGWLWFAGVAVALILLGGFIFYGQRRTAQPKHPIIKRQQDAATKRLYADLDKETE
jgi:hypothetical protein